MIPPEREVRRDDRETVLLRRDQVVERRAQADEILEQREPTGAPRRRGRRDRPLATRPDRADRLPRLHLRAGSATRVDLDAVDYEAFEAIEVCARVTSGRYVDDDREE